MTARASALGFRPTVAPALCDDVTTWLPAHGAPPLFIQAKQGIFPTVDASMAWMEKKQTLLDTLLADFGAIVFRDFAFETTEDFDRYSSLYERYAGGYVAGASPRSTVVGNVMEATRLAPDFFIWLHQEMAYLRDYPSRIAFFGRKVPPKGGATIIGDMREFTRRMPENFRLQIEKHGVRGVRNYAPLGGGAKVARHVDDKSWDDGFETVDPQEVEEICAAKGIQPIWNKDGSLTIVTITDGFAIHPVTGERIYRTNLHTNARTYEHFGRNNPAWDEARQQQAFHTGYTLGNGEEVASEQAREVGEIVDSLITRWQWRNGDIMLVDNLQVAHGRDPFEGDRETLVALFA